MQEFENILNDIIFYIEPYINHEKLQYLNQVIVICIIQII